MYPSSQYYYLNYFYSEILLRDGLIFNRYNIGRVWVCRVGGDLCPQPCGRSLLGTFKAHRHAHAPTDAKRGEAFFGVAPLHFEQQGV